MSSGHYQNGAYLGIIHNSPEFYVEFAVDYGYRNGNIIGPVLPDMGEDIEASHDFLPFHIYVKNSFP